MSLSFTALEIYAPIDSQGNARGPDLGQTQTYHTEIERLIIGSVSSGGALVFLTKSQMDADLNRAESTSAWVVADTVTGNNAIYRKIGASASGSWVFASNLPFQLINLAITGTANALVGTSPYRVPTDPRAVLLVFVPPLTNTGPVNLTINGSAALPLVGSNGLPLATGSLTGGTAYQAYRFASEYRLAIPSDIAAQVASAQAAAAAAAASAVAAAAAGFKVYETAALFAAENISASIKVAEVSGRGRYNRIAGTPAPVRSWHLQTADSGYWMLDTETISPLKLGATGGADDTSFVQDALDYAALTKTTCQITALHNIPTASLTCAAGLKVQGQQGGILRRTTDSPLPLLLASGVSGVEVRGLRFESIAGAASTTSQSISAGSKTFTVPAGLVFAVGNSVFIVVPSGATNYMIGSVTAYTGTSMTINVTNAIGSGTFTNWLICRNSGENVALRAINSPNCKFEDNTVSGRFYVGIESQNCDGGSIKDSFVTGVLNRMYYVYATSGTSDDVEVSGNIGVGGGFTQYGINLNGSTAGSIRNPIISANRIEGTTFQGIEVGGFVQDGSVVGNVIEDLASGAFALLVQTANGGSPAGISVIGNSIRNCPTGIFLNGVDSCVVNSNTVRGGADGIRVARISAGSCLGNTVSNNTLVSYTSRGITFESDSASLCGQSSVVGNILRGPGSGQSGLSFNVNTDRITYSANVMQGNATNSIGGTNHVASGNIIN
jgi:parallel beta-helix repeat protein